MLKINLMEIVFWMSLVAIVYTYILYPLVLLVFSRIFSDAQSSPSEGILGMLLPRVSLLIAAYNEEMLIEARIRNALATDYPADLLEIAVASDGSTDKTAEIVARLQNEDPRIRLFNYEENRGKSTVLNSTIPQLQGEIVIFSDANTFFDANAVKLLVTDLQNNPNVGVVSGRLVLSEGKKSGNVDSLYWKMENCLKQTEAKLGGLLGANGAIYAIRKDSYISIPEKTMLDDFTIPMLIKMETGQEIAYNRLAFAREETAPTIANEFQRRCRIGAGAFQSLTLLWPLLDPRRGWVSFTFLSHKVLRWLCPFFMIIAFIANMVLAAGEPISPVYQALFYGQLAFYTLALFATKLPGSSKLVKVCKLPTMFTAMNMALLVGFFRWVRGLNGGAWTRTPRMASELGNG